MQAAHDELLSDADIASMISGKNADVSVRLFELLPQFVQGQDSDDVLKGFFEAVQAEYDRNRKSITDIIAIIDPKNVNKNYLLEGNFVFFHPEQFIYGGTASSPNKLAFTGPNQGVVGSGYYSNFGIFVWSDATTPASVGQYKIITSYDGSTQTATLDSDWAVLPSSAAVYALCWPDRVWLPTPIVSDPRKAQATLFPLQAIDSGYYGITDEQAESYAVLFPGLSYLATISGYYKGWTLDFLDGVNAGRSVKIVDYITRDTGRVAVLAEKITTPDADDWFRISPPSDVNQLGISDNFYAGRWLHVAAPTVNDITYAIGKIQAQSRQIISSRFDYTTTPVSHVAYIHNPITDEGEKFKYPPAPTFSYGISNSYIPLQYLANYVGIDLDPEDPEPYQRVQISQAYSFHRLKGTRRALELVCRAFGMDLLVDEASSNYTHAPSSADTGPYAAIEGGHKYYSNSELVTHILQGRGLDDVPSSYRTTDRDTARIPDSAIKIYLSRVNTNLAPFDGRILRRIIKKLSPHIPIHVQIVFVGLLTRISEPTNVDAKLTCQISPLVQEPTAVREDFLGTPIGTVPFEDTYPTVTDLDVAIAAPARYSRVTARYGRFGAIPATARWTVGSILFLE